REEIAMNPIARRSQSALAAAFVLSLAVAALPAAADPHCRIVHGHVDLAAGAPTCGSAIGLCAGGVLTGGLKANSDFIGTSSVPPVDTGATGVVVLTGDNTIHTKDGDLLTKDAIVLQTSGDGQFAEVDTVVGGTGEYAGATGFLNATGTFVNGA